MPIVKLTDPVLTGSGIAGDTMTATPGTWDGVADTSVSRTFEAKLGEGAIAFPIKRGAPYVLGYRAGYLYRFVEEVFDGVRTMLRGVTPWSAIVPTPVGDIPIEDVPTFDSNLWSFDSTAMTFDRSL
jgi:hypothetical protein